MIQKLVSIWNLFVPMLNIGLVVLRSWPTWKSWYSKI